MIQGSVTVERLSFSSNGTILLPNGEEFHAAGWNWGHWILMQDGDAQLNAQEGANIVRIIFRWWGPYPDKRIDSYNDTAEGHLNPENLAVLDRNIQQAVDAGLWINLAFDSDCGQNGAANENMEIYCAIDGKPAQNFWNNLDMRTKFKEAWTYIVNRYKDIPRLAWYEILPEPDPPGFTDSDVKDFYADMIPVLRAGDPKTPILIGPSGAYFAFKINTIYDPSFENVVYTADFLAPTVFNTSRMLQKVQTLTSFRASNNVPVFVQQVGITITLDPDGSLLDEGLQLLIDNDIGFTGWEYRGPSYGEYSPWYQNGTKWGLKEITYNIYKSKFAQWATPLNYSLPTENEPYSSEPQSPIPITYAPQITSPSSLQTNASTQTSAYLFMLSLGLVVFRIVSKHTPACRMLKTVIN
jgi:hypothetical protein